MLLIGILEYAPTYEKNVFWWSMPGANSDSPTYHQVVSCSSIAPSQMSLIPPLMSSVSISHSFF